MEKISDALVLNKH